MFSYVIPRNAGRHQWPCWSGFVISGFTLARSDHDIHSCISVWYNAHYVLWVLPTSYYKDSIYGFRIIRCVICFETHSPEPQASLVYVRAGFLPSLGPCSILGSTRIGASGEFGDHTSPNEAKSLKFSESFCAQGVIIMNRSSRSQDTD